jgi:hypothetical protein
MKKYGIFRNNKRNIIIRDNEKETCMLIDVANTGDRHAIKKEAIKVLKCKDLTIKTQFMWIVEIKVTPLIMGTTGTI